MTLLNDAEWSQWSSREIARHAAVSHNFVSVLRKETTVIGLQSTSKRRGKDGRTINTEKIGSTAKAEEASRRSSVKNDIMSLLKHSKRKNETVSHFQKRNYFAFESRQIVAFEEHLQNGKFADSHSQFERARLLTCDSERSEWSKS